jgi:hypothetical protein
VTCVRSGTNCGDLDRSSRILNASRAIPGPYTRKSLVWLFGAIGFAETRIGGPTSTMASKHLEYSEGAAPRVALRNVACRPRAGTELTTRSHTTRGYLRLTSGATGWVSTLAMSSSRVSQVLIGRCGQMATPSFHLHRRAKWTSSPRLASDP